MGSALAVGTKITGRSPKMNLTSLGTCRMSKTQTSQKELMRRLARLSKKLAQRKRYPCKEDNMLPKLLLKNCVKINGRHFSPEVRRILDVAVATAPETVGGSVVVTSGNDSRHMPGSKHYTNEAFDIRIRNVIGGHPVSRTWVAKMSLALGEDYDVVLECDHIHAELDKK